MVDPLAVEEDMYELGLVPLCAGWIGREEKRRRCGIETVRNGAFCIAHGGDQLITMRSINKQRKILEDVLLPQATQRVMQIISDPDAKDADVVRVWSTIMDRVGLAAMQNVTLQADVNVAAPMEILKAMLMGSPAQAIEGVIDGEVVSEEQTG